MSHFTISQASVIALVTQLASFVGGFGVIDSMQTGIIIAASTAAVNAAFLIANAIHHLASTKSAATPVAVVAPQLPRI